MIWRGGGAGIEVLDHEIFGFTRLAGFLYWAMIFVRSDYPFSS